MLKEPVHLYTTMNNIFNDKSSFARGREWSVSFSSLLRPFRANVALNNGKALSQRRFKKVSNDLILIHAFRLQTCFEKRPPYTLNTVNIERA